MTVTRITVALSVVVGIAVCILAITKLHGLVTPLATIGALVFLIGGGNLLYGKNSHGAKALARTKPAQEAHDRAIDEARRQAAADHANANDPTPNP